MPDVGATTRKRSLVARILAFLATPPPPPRRHFSKHWSRASQKMGS
ncbi:MAG TPA: hypothetical protein VMU95_14440 [Trebonia sp.]|nr:hypothetical protein [Trebonia sp.]